MLKAKKLYAFSKLDPIKPTIAFDTYWRFAFERQEVFLKRLRGFSGKSTNDPIIQQYKFTNAYRACDRVSQYLIRDVIYTKRLDLKDTFLRIILFKLFNKIETWKLLEKRFGFIATDNFSVEAFVKFLNAEMNRGRTLYSNAYMMASGCKEFQVTRKHHAHMLLIEKMLKEDVPQKISDCRAMKDSYQILLSYPLIGSFLAYQYATDLNYSDLTNFLETEFTVPGPGARDGIRKCFFTLGGISETELIKILTDSQEHEFERLGLDFKTLGGRPLQYIDIQNIFCETDKYCRVAHPDIKGLSNRTKIKQVFKINEEPIKFFFPPKWNIDMEALHGHR